MAFEQPFDDTPDGVTYNGRTAPQLASDAEHAVQGISHVIDARGDPLEPEDLYRALSGLTRLVEQLPEAISRISAQMAHRLEDHDLVVTAGRFYDDPTGAVTYLNATVTNEVLPALARLKTGLDHAQGSVNQVTRHRG